MGHMAVPSSSCHSDLRLLVSAGNMTQAGLWQWLLRVLGVSVVQLAWRSVPSVRWARAGTMLPRNPGE